jgi:hypothetical protein
MTLLNQAIMRQIDHSGVLLLKVASVLTDEEFFFQPTSGASMAWTLGHLSALQDWAVNRVFLGREPLFSRERREALKGGRKIHKDDHSHFNERPELQQTFASSQERTLQVLSDYPEEKWNQPTPSGCRFPTYGALWEHLAVHNGWHLGAISVSLPRVSQMTLFAPRFYSVDTHDLA